MSESKYKAIMLLWDHFYQGVLRFEHEGQQFYVKKRKYGRTDITHMQIEVGRLKFTLNKANLSFDKFMEYVAECVSLAKREAE